jgi:solute carrier family 25 oxoglutarate transporter 11
MSSEIKNLVIGSISGISPLIISLPIDYVKVSIQVQAEGHRHFHSHPFSIIKEVFKTKGIREFYRGLPGAIQRQFFLGGLRLGGYRIALEKANSLNPSGPLSLLGQSILSFFVGGFAAWVASPFDLVLIRLQSDRLLPDNQKRNYSGTFNALNRIIKEEGFTGLWKGASTVVLRVAVINSISIPGYELIKQELDYLYGFAASHRIYASVFSSVLSCVASLPVDNFKTKMQKMVRNPDGSEPYRNIWDCLRKSIQREGVAGLYVGFPVYVTRIAPHVILSMLLQDFLHHHFK